MTARPPIAQFGDAIPTNGVRLPWLPDDVGNVLAVWGDVGQNKFCCWTVGGLTTHNVWPSITAIRLEVPRYDFVYLALERGMVPYFGQGKPDDWDQSKPVLFRDSLLGRTVLTTNFWDWTRNSRDPVCDIIGYHATSTALPLARLDADVCAYCDFPWGADPVRHSEFCDNRTLAHTAAPQGEDMVSLLREAASLAGRIEAAGPIDHEHFAFEAWKKTARDLAPRLRAAIALAAIASGRGEGE